MSKITQISPIKWRKKIPPPNFLGIQLSARSPSFTKRLERCSFSDKQRRTETEEPQFEPPQEYPEKSVHLYVENMDRYGPPGNFMTQQELKRLGTDVPPWRLAGRLAVKEAILKYLGIPEEDRPLYYKHIGSFNDPSGRPHLTFNRIMRKVFRERGIHRLFYSISHTEKIALSYVESRVDTAAIGCDIESIQTLYQGREADETFLNYLFTTRERERVETLSQGQSSFFRKALYTRIWAGKEAVAKALGTGLEYPTGIHAKDIEILLLRGDKEDTILTEVRLDERKAKRVGRAKTCKRILKSLGASRIEIITSHGDQHAAAWVRLVLEKKPLEMAHRAQEISPIGISKKGKTPRVIMVFADCVGIGENDPSINPIAKIRSGPSSGVLAHFLDEFRETPKIKQKRLRWLSSPLLVAPLTVTSPGVPDIPGSNTNQVSLYTGVDIASVLGKYATGLPDQRTIGILTRANILRQLVWMGVNVYSANAYPPWFLGDMWLRNLFASPMQGLTAFKSTRECKKIKFLRKADQDKLNDRDRVWPPEIVIAPGSPLHATAYMIKSTGQVPPSIEDVIKRRALFNGMDMGRYLDIFDFSPWGYPNEQIPNWSFRDAGQILAEISRDYEFTLFSTTVTDWASHRDVQNGNMRVGSTIALGLSQFLHGLMEKTDPDDSLVIMATDHGGLEDIRHGHTANPGMFLSYGKYSNQIAERVKLLIDVVPAIMGIFS